MVLDGFLYALALGCVGVLAALLGGPAWAIPEFLLAAFALYFFRDPERAVPPGACVVSPADGHIVDLREIELDGQKVWKISIFLSLLDVHIIRAPIAGVIRDVHYTPGKFLVASNPEASVVNEQNTVTIEGERYTVRFKQIAGVLARRIVFRMQVGDRVECGERVGLIKFGSRADIFLPLDLLPQVALGEKVRGCASVLASPRKLSAKPPEPLGGEKRESAGAPLRD